MLTVLLALLFLLDGLCRRRHSSLIAVVQGLRRRRTGLAVSMVRSSRIESRVGRILGWPCEGAPRIGRVAGSVFVLAMAAGSAVVASGSLRAEDEPAAWGGQRALALPMSGITVDGRLDDWPAEVPVYPIRSNTDAYGPTDISGADLDASLDFSPSFRAGYNPEEQRIYVAVEVRDDSVHARETGHQDTDALEIYLAARPGAEPVYYVLCPPGGAYGPGRPNPSVLVPGLGEMPLDRSGSRAAVGREGGTTVYEWAVEPVGDSLEDVVELRPGMVLGFDVAAVDQDSETDTAAWISWTPPTRKFSGGGRIGGLVLGRAGGDLGSVAVQGRGRGRGGPGRRLVRALAATGSS